MSRKASLPFVFCAAIFLAPLGAHAQDIEISFEPTFRAEHGGFSLYNGNPVDPYVFPDEVTIRSSELTSVDGEWRVEELQTWFQDVPQERGVYILARVGADSFVLDGTPARGDNYDLAHVAFSASATSTHTFTLSMPFFGDTATPSGRYLFFAAELPETKTVYDADTDTGTTLPYTDDDLGAWLANPRSPDTFRPRASTMEAVFEYINDGSPPCTQDCFSNVLFLPGIEGSRLYENDERLWEGKDDQVQLLYLDDNGASKNLNIYAKDVIDVFTGPPISVAIYDSFLGDLAQKRSDGVIEDYAAVAYDWRLSIPDILASGTEEPNGAIYYNRATSTPYIEQTLRRLADSSRTGKVTIVGHSNGGLLAKALISELGDEAGDLIDKVIMVGVPQLGTPKAIGALLHGYDTGIPFVMSDERARDFAHNAPMAYQLLPDPDYYQNTGVSIGTPLITFEPGTSTQAFVDAYGLVIGNADELHGFLVGAEGRDTPTYDDTASPAVGSESLLTEAEQLKQLIGASWQAPAGITVHQIAGIGEDTLAGITYKTVRECTNVVISSSRPICTSYKDRISYTPNEVIDGDGTVVVPSALAMSESEKVKRWWIDLDNYNKILGVPVPGIIRKNHKDLLEIRELRAFIFENLIEGTSVLLPENVLSSAPTLTDANHLRFVLHSPLTLAVTDSNSNTVSTDTTTIPGGTYAQYGDVQVITVPSGSGTTVSLNGIVDGTFTLDVEEYSGGTLVDSATFSGVPSGTNTVATLNLQSGTIASASNLTIDYDGDGTADVELPAGELVSYEQLVTEDEQLVTEEDNEDESNKTQGGSGGGTIVGLITFPTIEATTSTATSSEVLPVQISHSEESVKVEQSPQSSPELPRTAAVANNQPSPVSALEDEETEEPHTEEAQLATVASATSWYDVFMNAVTSFFTTLYEKIRFFLWTF